MGLTDVTVVIHGELGSRPNRLLVDAGSTYTWINEELLKQIGVTPLTTERFRIIDKRTVERPVADIVLEYEGTWRYCPVAFAEKDDANVLGSTAMEIIGLEVDPSTRQVKRITAHAAY